MDHWSAHSTFILLPGAQIPVKQKISHPPSPSENSADQNDNENIHPLFLVTRPKKSQCFVAIFYNIKKGDFACFIAGIVTRSHPFWVLHPKSPFFKNYFFSLAPEIALFWKKGDFFSVGNSFSAFKKYSIDK